MKIEESYLRVSGFFDYWVRLMEIQTRNMEVQDSGINDLKILIISPPTDRGISVLTKANPRGESHLICFSESLGEMAKEYSKQYNIEGLDVCVEPFFSIPFGDGYFDAIFANCFFDFCKNKDLDGIIKETKRALKNEGLLFSVYMDVPADPIGQIWAKLFDKFQFLSKGCHPVDLRPFLSEWGFKLKKDLVVKRLGFPIKYLIAEV